MSIASAIQNAQTKVANAYTAVDNKGGTLPATQNLSNLPTAINSIQTGGDVTNLTVTPTTSQQSFSKQGQYDGYNPVTVNAVTSAIDNNIQAKYIKKGISILGVEGTMPASVKQMIITGLGTNSNNINILYIDNEGTLFGKGTNTYYNLGTGSNTAVNDFIVIAKNVACIAGNEKATWYVTESGELFGCGSNLCGQQGNGLNDESTYVTVFTKRAENVKSVTCGFASWAGYNPTNFATTCYISNDNELFTCGSNACLQQNQESWRGDRTTFAKVADNVLQVITSGLRTAFINTNNELHYVLYNSINTVQASSVRYYTVASDAGSADASSAKHNEWYISTDDKLFGKGYNNCGQQGSGSASSTSIGSFTQRATGVLKVYATINTTVYLTNITYPSGTTVGMSGGIIYYTGARKTSSTNITTFTAKSSNTYTPVLDLVITKESASIEGSTSINVDLRYITAQGLMAYYTTTSSDRIVNANIKDAKMFINNNKDYYYDNANNAYSVENGILN